MRLGMIGLLAAAAVLCSACGPEPGSPEWCKNTPVEKQTESPAGMSKCLEAESRGTS